MAEQLNRFSEKSTFSVRPSEPRDYDKIADLAGQLGYPSTAKQVQRRIDAMANSKEYAVYVAELPEGQIVGCIGLYVFRSVVVESSAGISGLIIDQHMRSRGVGKALLDAAEKWARSLGCKAISVHSNVTRERAHQFYARNGYEYVKTQKYLVKAL